MTVSILNSRNVSLVELKLNIIIIVNRNDKLLVEYDVQELEKCHK